jgi:diacylglycerol kinase family enzyme
MNRVLIVVNPIAGRGKAVTVLPELIKKFSERGITPQTYFTTANPVDDALDEAILQSEAVIAMGGDGTLNRVARPIVLRAKPGEPLPAVGLIAMGTGNVAAGVFHLPQRLSEIVDCVAMKKTHAIDVGVVSQNAVAIAVFLLWLGAGLDGAVIHAVAAIRSRYVGSWLMPRYFLEAPRTLFTYPFPDIEVSSRGTNGVFASVIVANVGSFGVGGVTKKADPTDGNLNVIATAPRSRLSWCLSGLMAGFNCYDFCWGVRRSEETHVTVLANEAVPVQVDGEPFGPPPFSIQIRKAALSLLSP